jgi:hypothetical protein
MNMMYSNPIVEKRSTALFFSNIFNPWGPIINPEIINPIIPGIFSLRKTIGARSIIKSINEKTRTGLFRGNSNLDIKFSKRSSILSALFCYPSFSCFIKHTNEKQRYSRLSDFNNSFPAFIS